MRRMKPAVLWSAVIAVAVAAGSVWAESGSPTITYTMRNGMEVILKENHSSPMIASIVFVRSGSKYETPFNNGATHFLEHLLFNGTTRRTQEEISDAIKRHGGYINAFTRQELTAYMTLMPREHIDVGLDIQQDMLFNSILPEDRFPKERKIVIEEIHQSRDNPGYIADSFYTAWAHRGSPYVREVLGPEALIASVPREDILEYYRTYYQPNNMIVLAVGDFDPTAMRATIDEHFGRHPASPLPERPAVLWAPPSGPSVHRLKAEVSETTVEYCYAGPRFDDPDYTSFYLLAEVLADDAQSPLQGALVTCDPPLASKFSVSLETQSEFSALRVSASAVKGADAEMLLTRVHETLAGTGELEVSEAALQGLVTQMQVDEIYLREKLHYYAIMRAPAIVTTGYDFMESLPDRLATVTQEDLRRAASKYLGGDDFVATAVGPAVEATGGGDIATPAAAMQSRFTRRVLDNGMVVIVKESSGSRVFAANVMGRHRSAHETDATAGITDYLNRMLMEGTEKRSAEELDEALNRIGARVTATDNPYIPYDDFYTTPQYSFIKFETIEDHAAEGIELLAEIVGKPALDVEKTEKVRRELLQFLGMSSGSPRNRCRALSYDRLFAGGAFARPVAGSHRTIGSIDVAALRAHHQRIYAAENIILTIVSSRPTEEVFGLVEKTFGKFASEAGTTTSIDAGTLHPVKPSGAVTAHEPMEKEQIYLFLSRPIPGVAHEDCDALAVANRILSTRLKDELREKHGLAYSVGSGISFDRDFGWHVCTMGTGFANYEQARDGIIAEIHRLATEGATEDELEIARNAMWGQGLTRRLSRVNQAYYMGVSEYLGQAPEYVERRAERRNRVTTLDVQRVAATYLDNGDYVLATAGKLE